MKPVKFIVMLKLCSTLQIVNEKLKFLKRTSKKDRSYDFSTLVYTYILLLYQLNLIKKCIISVLLIKQIMIELLIKDRNKIAKLKSSILIITLRFVNI